MRSTRPNRPNSKTSILILFSFVLALSISCGDAEVQNYTEEVVDGVRYIHNLKPKYDTPRISLEFVRQFGDLESEDENYQFFRPSDIGKDSKDNYYVVDAGNFMIKIFDKNAKYISSFGKKGQGPGEFQGPYYIVIDKNDNKFIGDYGSQSVFKFDSENNYKKSIKLEKHITVHHNYGGDKLLVTLGNFFLQAKNKPQSVFYFLKENGEEISGHGKIKIYNDLGLKNSGNNVFMDVDLNNNILVGYSHQNRIEKYDVNGKLITRIDRVLPFEESEETVRVPMTFADGATGALTYTNFFTNQLQIDNKGRIWSLVNTTQRAYVNKKSVRAEYQFEIFDNNGALLMNYRSDDLANYRSFKIINDKVYFIDRSKEMVVKEYKIVESN